MPDFKPVDASDRALFILLDDIKAEKDPDKLRQLSEQLEHVIFYRLSD